MKELLTKRLIEFGNYYITTMDIVLVLLVIGVTFLVLFFIKKSIPISSTLTPSEKGRRTSVFILIKYVIQIFSLLIILSILRIDIKLILAGSAALLVGIGFGLQGLFYDIIAGIIILFEQKIKVGDILELKDKVGKVTSISLRTSTLLTRDEIEIIIPNHILIKEEVINTSLNNPFRRMKVDICLDYNSDLKLVKEALIEAALLHPEVIKEEPYEPRVRLADFAQFGIKFELVYYTSEVYKLGYLMSNLRFSIFEELKTRGVKIATTDLHINI